MPLKIDCPRCKQSLAVPTKLIGSYVACPRCKGRLWIPEPERADAPQGGAASGAAVGKAGEPSADVKPATAGNGAAGGGAAGTDRSGTGMSWAPPLAASSPLGMRSPAGAEGAAAAPAETPGTRPPAGSVVPVPATGSARPPVPAAPRVLAKKTARLIPAEAAPSTVQRAADGKLPELRLDDGTRTVQSDEKGRAVSPLVLFAVLCLSAAFSMVAVMVDFGGPDPVKLRTQNVARQRIERNYFPLVTDQGRARPAEPYQRLLAEAARAHARGDRVTERRRYNRVLDLLRGERDRFQRGLTGSHERDKELEHLINILLSDV